MDKKQEKLCLDILKSELIPALGCTEPITIAYAAAKARQVLGDFPEHIDIYCSGNIIKMSRALWCLIPAVYAEWMQLLYWVR